jgi:hypothetical protein
MLRWGLQHGRSVIPKSSKPSRIAENINVFDFELSADEMAEIDRLDTGRRAGPSPTRSPWRRSAARSRTIENHPLAPLSGHDGHLLAGASATCNARNPRISPTIAQSAA